MWRLVLLICSVPASISLWTKEKVTGIVGRSITINCNYNTWLKDNVKYWCHGWTVSCTHLLRTTDPGGQRRRMSIKDYKTQGVFVVTMEDLRTEDAGWYSCGIDRAVLDELSAVNLKVSYEPVSVPIIRILPRSNISCFENSVSISCESAQGSLPIRYTWHEQISSEDSIISENNKLYLHCQLFKLQHHRYYCTASNTQGEKSSEMVHVSVIHRTERNCSFVAQIGSRGSTVVPSKNKVSGVLGRVITIECHYDKWSQLHVKFWSRQCYVFVKSADHHGQRGRISIMDNKTQNIFSVTMEDLRSEDAGWYSCGIDQSGHISVSAVELQISHEPVSVPVLRFLSSPPNASCSGSSVTISCESVHGSLPIQYTWYEKTPSEDSKISNTSNLDLHCQFFKQLHYQYYCTASNTHGENSSEMVNVSVSHRSGESCSYVVHISTSGADYCCEISMVPLTTANSKVMSLIDISPVYIVLGVLGAIFIVSAVPLLLYLRQVHKGKDGVGDRTDNAFENQQMVEAEEKIVYSTIKHKQSRSRGIQSERPAHFKNNTNEAMYAELQHQKKSSARNGETTSYSVTRGNAKVQSQLPENKVITLTFENPPESEMTIYAEVNR